MPLNLLPDYVQVRDARSVSGSHFDTAWKTAALIHGDCRAELRKISSTNIDPIITDPLYLGFSRKLWPPASSSGEC
jgi:hypothetical protein